MRPIQFKSDLRASVILILGILLASCKAGPSGPDANVVLSTTSLVFSGEADEQPITITNLGDSPIQWRLTSTSASWVTVSPATGTVSANGSETFNVRINRAAVPHGDHSAALQVITGTRPHTLDVTVNDAAAPKAEFQPGTLTLGPQENSRVIEVANTGGSTLQWNLTASAAWATVSPANGNLPPGATTEVVVSAHRAGLTRGTYAGTLYLKSNGGSPTATLALEVGEGAVLHLAPDILAFGLSSTTLPLSIVNQGYQTLNWSVVTDADWLALSASSGQVPPQSSRSIAVNVSRTGLPHGLHQAALRFSSNGGAAAVDVALHAAPQGSSPSPTVSPPRIEVSPASLNFGGTGTELPLTVHNEGDEPLNWTASVAAGWMTISPASGRISPHASGQVLVRVMRPGLTAGSYESAVRFESNGGSDSAAVFATVPGPGGPPGPDPGPSPSPDPDPDPEPNPGPGPSGARISVEPSSLDFGSVATKRSILVRNTGTAPLNWSAQKHSWLSLSAPSGSLSPGWSQTLTVEASRASLSAAGQYDSSIQFTSNGGSASLPVTLYVAVPSPPSSDDPPELDSIDATGATDVTYALNAYLASVPDGSTVRLPAGARYRAEGVVRIKGRHNLTLEGNGALIFANSTGSSVLPPQDLAHLWPRQRSHLEISESTNIVVRELQIRGANPNAGSGEGAYVVELEGQHGFDIRNVRGLILERVRATDTYGDLVYIGGKGQLGWSDDILIMDSHFERSGRQGIAMTGASNVTIQDSYIGEIGRTIIDLEPLTQGAGAQNILFTRNTFGPCRHLLLNAGGTGPNVDDVALIGNTLIGMQMHIRVTAADGSRRSGYRIINNRSDTRSGTPISPIRFSRVDGIEVRGNYQMIAETRETIAVSACESTDIIVENNEFPGAAKEFEIKPICAEEPDVARGSLRSDVS